MARSSQAKLKAPHAVLDLGVREEDESEVISSRCLSIAIQTHPQSTEMFTYSQSPEIPGFETDANSGFVFFRLDTKKQKPWKWKSLLKSPLRLWLLDLASLDINAQ